jgi:hypothetical protein
MIPCGSNPTGGTLSLERRKQLLRLATEHDLLIIEDDPYYYLQFGDRLPSLFSMCTDGRVIRWAKNDTGGSEACLMHLCESSLIAHIPNECRLLLRLYRLFWFGVQI